MDRAEGKAHAKQLGIGYFPIAFVLAGKGRELPGAHPLQPVGFGRMAIIAIEPKRRHGAGVVGKYQARLPAWPPPAVNGACTDSVITSYNQVVSDIATFKALEQAVISAESALKATEAGFEVGTRTIVDVLISTQNLYNAKRNLADVRYRYVVSTLRLKQATGTLSREDLVGINQGLNTVN